MKYLNELRSQRTFFSLSKWEFLSSLAEKQEKNTCQISRMIFVFWQYWIGNTAKGKENHVDEDFVKKLILRKNTTARFFKSFQWTSKSILNH